jgi:predicted GNAT family acetyltransferase
MSIDPDQVQHERSPSGGRFTYAFPDGAVAELSYLERSGVATITHTGTPPHHRGQGVAAVLVAVAVADFRAAGQKVIPACSYARDQFQAHPEWGDVLFRAEENTHG